QLTLRAVRCLRGIVGNSMRLPALAASAKEVGLLAPPPVFGRVTQPAEGEPGLEQPCAARRGRIQELEGAFLHFCIECGAFGAFGYGVSLRAGRLGRWYCAEHRPGVRPWIRWVRIAGRQ